MDPKPAPAPMTAETIAAVQFPLATPHGYYHVAVDSFIDLVMRSAQDWESRLEQAQHEAHQWAKEADRLQAENQSLRAQISVFQVNGDPMVDSSGGYVTQSQAEASLEIERLRATVTDLNDRLARASSAAVPQTAEEDFGPFAPVMAEPRLADEEPPEPPIEQPLVAPAAGSQAWVPVPPPPPRPGSPA